MVFSTVLLVSYANSSTTSVLWSAMFVFVFIFSFAPPMLFAQCCKKKKNLAKPRAFGPADDVRLCKTQDETVMGGVDPNKPVGAPFVLDPKKPLVGGPALPGCSFDAAPKSREKTCLPATTNVATVMPDPELKTRNMSLESVETKLPTKQPESAPIVKTSDKFINKGGGIFLDKDNKAISQYAPAPQNNG